MNGSLEGYEVKYHLRLNLRSRSLVMIQVVQHAHLLRIPRDISAPGNRKYKPE
jgi:hypothetical protein